MSNTDPARPAAKRPDSKRRARIMLNLSIIVMLVAAMAIAIVFMLFNTTVINADAWNRKGQRQLDTITPIAPLRGDILACDGSILATNLNYYDVSIDFKPKRFYIRQYVESLDSLADTLAVYFPHRTRAQWHAYLSAPLAKPRSKRSSTYRLVRNVPFDVAQRFKTFPFFRRSRNSNRTGLKLDPVLRRMYPYGDMARLSIGRVGFIPGKDTQHGISGLEQALDTLLYGTPGKAKRVMFTNRVAKWPIEQPRHGYTVTTTIDITIQDILESELGEMLVNSNADWGTAMIMEVATGDIKAISNLERDSLHPGKYIEAMNRAVLAYEPGSVMKTISMIAALEDGYALPVDKQFAIGHSYAYRGGRPIHDTHSPASLPVSRFLEYSSNIGMTKLVAAHYESNPNGFRERLRQMGFFDRFGTGIARERRPYIPTLENNNRGLVALSRMTFGYSTMIPPLYTCAIYNAVANDGRFVRPRLVKALRGHDGRDSIIPVSYVRDSIMSTKNARLLRDMLTQVVYGDGGTAKFLRDKTVRIAGKTGTAKIVNELKPGQKRDSVVGADGRKRPVSLGYKEGHYRVAFCGFYPAEKPKYTCIVVISDPRPPLHGPAVTAGAVLKNTALKLYARGYLDDYADITDNAPADPGRPTLYATFRNDRSRRIHDYIDMERAAVINRPAAVAAGHVPDVRGLGVREAVVRLEEAGFNVAFEGVGYVTEQTPAAGVPAKPGSRVNLTLRQI
ncbi:MAG: PASTA domain-containing protein [Muribaculaceae bacterium]|nr:PASTA domain-containing protein [Muribaculaceae bacterium]